MSNLTQHQLKFLGRLLDTLEASVRPQVYPHLLNDSDSAHTNVDLFGDEGDRASAASLMEANDSIIEHWVAELKAIDAAKQRIGEGHYGECLDCGEAIDYRRLAACPTAQRCIHCQTLFEKMHMSERYPLSGIHA